MQTILNVLPTRWRQKPAGIDKKRNYFTIAQQIGIKPRSHYVAVFQRSVHVAQTEVRELQREQLHWNTRVYKSSSVQFICCGPLAQLYLKKWW